MKALVCSAITAKAEILCSSYFTTLLGSRSSRECQSSKRLCKATKELSQNKLITFTGIYLNALTTEVTESTEEISSKFSVTSVVNLTEQFRGNPEWE